MQSQYGSHTVLQRLSDEKLFAERAQVPRVTISGFSWAYLGRWSGVFEFSFIVLLSYYQWIKCYEIHIYISMLNKHSGVLSYMVGWSARLILFLFYLLLIVVKQEVFDNLMRLTTRIVWRYHRGNQINSVSVTERWISYLIFIFFLYLLVHW
jgi:hypothetical protein